MDIKKFFKREIYSFLMEIAYVCYSLNRRVRKLLTGSVLSLRNLNPLFLQLKKSNAPKIQ